MPSCGAAGLLEGVQKLEAHVQTFSLQAARSKRRRYLLLSTFTMSGVTSTSGRLIDLTCSSSSSPFYGMRWHGSMRGFPRLRCATQRQLRVQPVASLGNKKYNKYK
jgi:hypothetical protein